MTGRVVDHAAAHRAALIATIWVPLAIVAACEAVVIGVGATGSSQLIVHRGADGDRYGPWWTYAILVAAIGFPVIALIGFFIARSTRIAGMNAWSLRSRWRSRCSTPSAWASARSCSTVRSIGSARLPAPAG